MTANEKAITAINEEARKRGLSYGQLVNRCTAEELQKIIRKYKPKKK